MEAIKLAHRELLEHALQGLMIQKAEVERRIGDIHARLRTRVGRPRKDLRRTEFPQATQVTSNGTRRAGVRWTPAMRRRQAERMRERWRNQRARGIKANRLQKTRG